MSIATASVKLATSLERSRFLRVLGAELHRALVPEMELTMRVAVMSAAGMTRQQICTQLDAPDVEVRMALERLKKIAEGWR